jgi:di/tricarboxylate transporter
MTSVSATFEIWVTLVLIVAAVVAYASERVSIELTSAGIVAILLVFFHLFPLPVTGAANQLGAERVLAGFANPALIAVVALLVIGQGMVRTGALDHFVRRLVVLRRRHPNGTVALTLVAVLVLSAVLNNTPVVVIFIPIITALSDRLGGSVSGLMMPLSFAAILGGMTTMIGSSTNLLVSSTAISLGHPPIGFFDFTIPGAVLALVGITYAVLVVPRILPDRASPVRELMEGDGKQYLTQIAVVSSSPLVGQTTTAGMFPSLPEMTVRLIQRGEHAFLPPFDGVALRSGDEVVVAATRKALTHVLETTPELLKGASGEPGDQILGEVVVAPASRMIGRDLAQLGFHYQTHCIVLGIQRRSRMIRARMDEIRLDAGDALLVLGTTARVMALRANRDVLLLERSTRELVDRTRAGRATLIFLLVVGFAASGLVPIVVAAVTGAAAMVAARCLNIHQAARAIDRRVIFLVGAALALGGALEATGGAQFLAQVLVSTLGAAGPTVVLSAFFLLVAAFTNVLSNNATAVLFAPIAINVAAELGIDPSIFLYALIFAANCSFATPMSYQTNLLVMAPGHYRFSDFVRAGLPLVVLMWVAFSLFAPWYYGLW